MAKCGRYFRTMLLNILYLIMIITSLRLTFHVRTLHWQESSINEQIDRMRHAATRALLERDDVIIVASVSCIYGIGSVETYSTMTQKLTTGDTAPRQNYADIYRTPISPQ